MSNGVSGGITSSHRYEVPLEPSEVWERISDVEAYRGWWAWLRDFDSPGLQQGAQWRCVVQPPLPYLVRFGVHLDRVEAPGLIEATVSGDVVGTAQLRIEPAAEGSVAILQSTLAPGNSVLRMVSRLAAPLARFGHDWVLDTGAKQFIARVITPSPTE